jgi:hypothetical protein
MGQLRPFEITDVSKWVAVRDESVGSKRKVWVMEPGTKRYWLLKYLSDSHLGEDWAEKIACEIAAALGLPHARVELASHDNERGCISLDFTENRERGELVLGRSLLRELDPQYPETRKFRNVEHTIDRIRTVLEQPWLATPAAAPVTTAPELFLGYLMLDALIGNVDRHHENWAVLDDPGASPRHAMLAPTFDHASSLGRELTDAERTKRVGTRDRRYTVEHYAIRKAQGAIYANREATRPLSPVDAFVHFGRAIPDATAHLLRTLRTVQPTQLTAIVHRIPDTRMSQPAKQFAVRFLETTYAHLCQLDPP